MVWGSWRAVAVLCLRASELPANLGVLWLYMIPEVFGVRYITGTVKRSLKCMNFASVTAGEASATCSLEARLHPSTQ